MKLLIEEGLGSENPALKRLASGFNSIPGHQSTMKSVCCIALLICHIELEFQKSTAVNLRNPLRSLWLSIGRAQPIGAWRQRKCRCGKSLYSSLFIIVIWNCGVFLSLEWLAGMRGEISAPHSTECSRVPTGSHRCKAITESKG